MDSIRQQEIIFYGFKRLLTVLALLDELVGNIEIAVEVEAWGFVMQVGTSLALIEQFKRFDGVDFKSLGQFH